MGDSGFDFVFLKCNFTDIVIMIRVLNVDWLAVYCGCSFLNEGDTYRFEEYESGTPVFKKRLDVINKVTNESVATLTYQPYSPLIPKDACIIQFKNRILYKPYWNEIVHNIMFDIHLVPRSISRVDICCDFHRFQNNLHPENFIRKFVQGEYLKMKKCVFGLEGHQDLQTGFDYIRFGKREHEISCYLYNKTKELQEVKDKPYIRQAWKEGGLDEKETIWRMEFSLRTKQLRNVQRRTGEFFRLSLEWLKTKGMIEAMFDAVEKHYMDFRINDGQAQKRRMKKLILFNDAESIYKLYTPTNTAQTGRMDKIIINKLAHYVEVLRMDRDEFGAIMDNAAQIYAERKNLVDYWRQAQFKAQQDVKGD